MTPQRVQLSRKLGWRKPEGAIVVARPSGFGNPFTVKEVRNRLGVDEPEARSIAVSLYSGWLRGVTSTDYLQGGRMWTLAHLFELRGHDLACWCPLDQRCHADFLLGAAEDWPGWEA